MNSIKRKQSGFTLVEIAVVLVVIGLLIGGVLKGQSLIVNGKVKALAGDFRNVSTVLNGYQDRYRALPGDDLAVRAHTGNTTVAVPTAATANSGSINTGTWVGAATAAAGNESSLFWSHVRVAGLAGGGTNTSGQATNAIGGLVGITSTAGHVTMPAGVSATFFTCASGIEGNMATQLDVSMDDGVGTTGNMVGAVDGGTPITTATAAAAYTNGNRYTVCLGS